MTFMSREQFDSIVKHHISPVVGRIRLDPENVAYLEQLGTAYDRVFEDLNSVLEITEANDHPDIVEFNDNFYTVHVDRDSDGEIEYFQLVDAADWLFFEMDWAGPIDTSTIVKMLKTERSS